MRYFRNDGPSCIVRDGDGMQRFVHGRDSTAGEPGGRLAYDDTTPTGAKSAEQFAHMPGWHEEDAAGNAIFAPRPKAAVLAPSLPEVPVSSGLEVATPPPARITPPEDPQSTEGQDPVIQDHDEPAEAG
jgi:hypothetical protein